VRKANPIRPVDLLGVFWRSFFIQASWSFDRMQSLGFSFAMIPVLRRLYPDPEEYSRRLAAHMDYFNTQPYLAAFVLGAAARVEEERASGRNPAADPAEIKKSLMAPLGALGDSFFWGALKPFAAAVAVATLLAGSWWAPLLFLAVFNLVHIGLRASLVFSGYASSGDAVVLMSRYHLTRMARTLKILSLGIIGGMVGTVTAWGPAFRVTEQLPGPVLTAGGLAFTLLLTGLLRLGVSPVRLMLGLAALCLGLALGGII
jgi:mannose/fructose/N-acetylgalactosamine-specific phosphotransferase system component IID